MTSWMTNSTISKPQHSKVQIAQAPSIMNTLTNHLVQPIQIIMLHLTQLTQTQTQTQTQTKI